MNKPLVSIIIVNWNGKRFLPECLGSLYQQSYPYFEVIFVDNASNDGSVKYVKKYFPKTKIIVNNKNFGYAKGNNIGFKYSKGDFILFLNNDTKVTKPFLTNLINNINKNKAIGGAQSKILLMDNPKKLDSVGAFLTYTGFLYHYGVNKKDSVKYSKRIWIYSAKGACMLFKREVLEKVLVNDEIFDSRYFAYFEETDLCHRVWLAGYKVIFEPTSIIYHKWGGTSKHLDNGFIQGHSYKNRINSFIKNLSIPYLYIILPTHLTICYLISFLYLVRLKPKLFLSIHKAILWNVVNIRQTIRMRKYIQTNIRKIQDRDIIGYVMKLPRLSYFFYIFFGLESYMD